MRIHHQRLKRSVFTLSAICVLALTLAVLRSASAQNAAQNPAQNPAQNNAAVELFEKRIRPLLLTNCAKCHNTQAQVAKLDLTTAAGFAKGGESGPLIDRGMPEESRLLKVIGYNETLKMPPTGKLKDDDIAALTAWVKLGAPWPSAPGVAEAVAAKPKSTTREFTAANSWSALCRA